MQYQICAISISNNNNKKKNCLLYYIFKMYGLNKAQQFVLWMITLLYIQ